MGQGATISLDLRIRVVEAVDNGVGTLKEIAEQFSIHVSSVKRLIRLVSDTGSVNPSPNRGHPPRLVDDLGRRRIEELILEIPDATLSELADMYNSSASTTISVATMGREVRSLNFTRKKNFSSFGKRRSSVGRTPS